jgi:hypothetical protein
MARCMLSLDPSRLLLAWTFERGGVSECAWRLTCRDADEDKRGEKRQDDTSEAPAVSRAPVVNVRATLPKRPASHRAVCHHAGTQSSSPGLVVMSWNARTNVRVCPSGCC